jgi:hypothetical protein
MKLHSALSCWLLVACAEHRAQDLDDAGSRAASRGSSFEGGASPAPEHDAGAMPAPVRAADAAADASLDASAQTAGDLDAAARADAAPSVADAGSSGCAQGGFCADFEDLPKGALSGAWSARTPNCSGDGTASVDDAQAHSGRHSVRVVSGGGTCNHVFATPALDLSGFEQALWVRFYVRFASALSDAHVTFLALQDQVTQKALRMGGQKQILMWNRESDDATLPELSPTGVSLSQKPSPDSWLCVEFHLAGSAGTLETFVDGERVPGLVIDGAGTQDIDGQWLRPGKWTARVSELGFGWESYGNDAMTLWFDDIAVAAERVGC